MSTSFESYKDGEEWWPVRTLASSSPLKFPLQVILGIHVANIFYLISFNFFMILLYRSL